MRLSGNTLIIAEHDPTAQDYIRLVQLDAATGKPAGSSLEIKSDKIRFRILSFIEPGPFFAIGEGSAWVSDFGAGEVLRIGLPLRGAATPTPLPTQQTANPTGNVEPVPGGSGTLVLSDFEIKDPMDAAGQVDATYSINWRGSGFPGFRQCAWTAYDQTGQKVGSKVDIVAALAPHVAVPVRFDVTSPASSMRATCGDRLDVGIPYRYDFSNVTVQGESDGYYTVGFDAKWVAPGQAGAVACSITVMDASGTVMGSDTHNLFIVDGGTRVGTARVKATSSETTGLSASIDCVPFSG